MRGRIVLFVFLAIVIALVAVYAGWSTNTPKAVGEPSAAAPSDSSVGATEDQASGSAAARSPAASSPKTPPAKTTPAKPSPAKTTPAKTPPASSPPEACTPTAAAKPAAYATPSDQKPATDPVSQPHEGADPLHFGPVTPEGTHDTFDVDVSDDRRALTAAFSDLEVTVGNGTLTECDVTRSFAMALPLAGSDEGARVRFHVQGYAFVMKGTTARLTLRGNGRRLVKNFPVGSNSSFLQTLDLPATPGTTYQLSTAIEVHQDPEAHGTAGYLNVLAIDVAID